MDKTLRFRRKGYPSDLVPFATGGGQDHFAMRFHDGANPEVVYVFPDGDAEATGYWTWIPIAPSFDALLLALDRD
ncbi:MAG: SMI1/KNR4 family protein [Sandaracinus sp.]|nr:SMI1/KNR4 family protein [Sandaracinus sp.]